MAQDSVKAMVLRRETTRSARRFRISPPTTFKRERRGREPYAKITGIGRTTDARHLTEPNPEGAGILRAMQLALHGAGLDGQQVDYINPHGTGTVAGDGPESWAMHSINPRVQVSATKSTLGHSLGACGSIETAICALATKEQTIPPMRNLDELAEDCAPLDYSW